MSEIMEEYAKEMVSEEEVADAITALFDEADADAEAFLRKPDVSEKLVRKLVRMYGQENGRK